MKYLFVFDYMTATVHLYDVSDELDIDTGEELVNARGHKADSCNWMLTDNKEVMEEL